MTDELTQTEIEHLKHLLLQTRDEAQSLLRASHEGSKPVSLDTPIGRLSRMDAMQSQKMAEVQKGRTQVRLQLIAAALDKLERGVFGDCAKCQEPIGYKRLSVNPEGPFCLACLRP